MRAHGKDKISHQDSQGHPKQARAFTGYGADILALQSRVGNRVVLQMLRPQETEPVTIQRVHNKVNIRSKGSKGAKAGTISSVSFKPWRPASNAKIQGQHRTAFVAFKDAINNRVADHDIQSAAGELRDLIKEFKDIPKMKTGSQHANNLNQAFDACDLRLQNVTTASDLESEIEEIMSIRNLVPGTAAVTKNTGGHSEATTSGDLSELEKALRENRVDKKYLDAHSGEKAVADKARSDMWRLLDYNPPAGPASQETEDILVTHIHSLRSAYPATWNWLTENGYYLREYLHAHWGEKNMPLANMDGNDFYQIMTKRIH